MLLNPFDRRRRDWTTIGCTVIYLILAIAEPGRGQPAETTPQTNSVASPRELFRLFELDESQLRVFTNGQPISDREWDPIYRLLHLMPRLDASFTHFWSQPVSEWQSILDSPSNFRAHMFHLAGRVTQLQRQTLSPEAARRFDFHHVYQLHVESVVASHPLILLTREIPQSWNDPPETALATPRPISCDGLFLKTTGPDPHPQLVFLTSRIAWHPNQPDPQLGVTAGGALLGSLGMDISLLERVQQRQKLSDEDRDGFYHLLHTVSKLPHRDQLGPAPDMDLVAALKTPERLAGERFRLQGLARRAVLIRVADTDIQQRFGIRSYFEIEFFAPLQKSLRLVDAQDGQERLYHNYPMTVCCNSLPPGMPVGDFIRQPIAVDGFFMKLWAYRSQFAAGDDAVAKRARRQISPLLIARTVELNDVAPARTAQPAWAMVAVIFGGALVAMTLRWWYRRGDRSYVAWRQRRANRQSPDLSQLDAFDRGDAKP